MKRQCGCKNVVLDIDADSCIVTCQECEWHYTYKAVPKRLIQALEQLLVWLTSRGVEASPSKGVETDNDEEQS